MSFLRGFLRYFFRHFYTTLSWSYDAVAWVVSIGQWNNWVRTALDPMPDEPILEIGHGPGHLLAELCRRDRRVVGVDASMQMGRITRRRSLRAGQNVATVRALSQALPFAKETFSSLISTFPTEFILDPDSLAESWRVLRPSGKYVIVPMAEIRGGALFDRMAAWLFRATGQYADLPASWAMPMEETGYQVRRDDMNLERARVIRLVATKSLAAGP